MFSPDNFLTEWIMECTAATPHAYVPSQPAVKTGQPRGKCDAKVERKNKYPKSFARFLRFLMRFPRLSVLLRTTDLVSVVTSLSGVLDLHVVLHMAEMVAELGL